MKIILASQSPYRRKLCEDNGICISGTVSADIDEHSLHPDVLVNLEEAKNAVYKIAIEKNKVASKIVNDKDAYVISADTDIYINKGFLNKFENEKDYREKMKWLSGSKHQIITGACVYKAGIEVWSDVVSMNVEIDVLLEEDIQSVLDFWGDRLYNFVGYNVSASEKDVPMIKKIHYDSAMYNTLAGLPIEKLKDFFLKQK